MGEQPEGAPYSSPGRKGEDASHGDDADDGDDQRHAGIHHPHLCMAQQLRPPLPQQDMHVTIRLPGLARASSASMHSMCLAQQEQLQPCSPFT